MIFPCISVITIPPTIELSASNTTFIKFNACSAGMFGIRTLSDSEFESVFLYVYKFLLNFSVNAKELIRIYYFGGKIGPRRTLGLSSKKHCTPLFHTSCGVKIHRSRPGLPVLTLGGAVLGPVPFIEPELKFSGSILFD